MDICHCLRGIDYKLLLVMVTKKTEERSLDLGFLFWKEKKGLDMIDIKVDYWVYFEKKKGGIKIG